MVEVAKLDIRENVPLKERTTFRIGGPARWFVEVTNSDQLRAALAFADQKALPVFVLGGGSNLLISDQGVSGLVIAMASRGIDIHEETDSQVILRVSAGETWDNFVAFAVGRACWGVENMSLIPGSLGAVPIQNVGAYGQDASQVIREVEVLERASGEVRIIPARDCGFAYRRSIFNREQKGNYIILSATFSLLKTGTPNLSHTAVRNRINPPPIGRRDALKRKFLTWMRPQAVPDPRRMREIIIDLRKDGRLPDPEQFGSAGSFFQSPLVPEGQLDSFQARLRECLPPESANRLLGRCYRDDGGLKVPAAELIRIAGAGDAVVGGAELHSANPSIMVNRTGSASACDVLELANRVRQDVFDLSGLLLPVEPELVGFDVRELSSLQKVAE